MLITKRNFLFTAAALPLLSAAKGAGPGIRLGVQSYSFRDMLAQPGDVVNHMIEGMHALDLRLIELFEPTIQPPALTEGAAWRSSADGKPSQASLFGRPPEGPPPADAHARRERVRAWRLETPISTFRDIGKRFRDGGIKIQAFNYTLHEDSSDGEITRGFEMAHALGTDLITMSTEVTTAERLVPFVERAHFRLGLHGHSNLRDPKQLATPESFEKCLAMSPRYVLNLDIGHFAAAGFDTVAFIKQHAARICSVHLKDRKAHDGANMPYGEGDTPIADTVRLLRDHYPRIPAFLEYEYAGGPSIPALMKARDYVYRALKN